MKIHHAFVVILRALATTGAIDVANPKKLDATTLATLNAQTTSALSLKLAVAFASPDSLKEAITQARQTCQPGKSWTTKCEPVPTNHFTISSHGMTLAPLNCPTGSISPAGSEGLASCTYDPTHGALVMDRHAQEQAHTFVKSMPGVVVKPAIVLSGPMYSWGTLTGEARDLNADNFKMIWCVHDDHPQHRESTTSKEVVRSDGGAKNSGSVWIISNSNAISTDECDQYSVWLPAVGKITDLKDYLPFCTVKCTPKTGPLVK